MMGHRKGFTLIELLVVIAIIAILAAMLFPVFARARESARKIQCLANVKNIAAAVQMYLADYGRFPTGAHDQGMQDVWNATQPGGGGGGGYCWKTWSGNPFLRWPVVLDEYTKNRDVWRCPSARDAVSTTTGAAAWIVPNYTAPWWQFLMDHRGEWGRANQYCSESGGGGPCCVAFPSGWGGTVTDAVTQRALASEKTGSFVSTIGTPSSLDDVKESQILDPAWLVVSGDTQHWANFNTTDTELYYLCAANDCAWADWENCTWTQECGLDKDEVAHWRSDASFRNKYTRHLGGVNLGFADGHAAWWHADAVRENAPYCDSTSGWTIVREGRKLRGFCPVGVN
jgi:prepilin-type N-terminal cleavage/methylation domain-containing protein/prepilin-type processing-associated H-X9-DG protein